MRAASPSLLGLPRALLLLLIAIAGAYVWLIGNVPYVAFAFAGYDDAHFVHQAAELLTGQWLGPYDNFTLIKGPFFPVWIAAAWALHLPLLASEALLYVAAGLLLLTAVRPHFRTAWTMLPVLVLLLLNPTAWDAQLLRVMREGLYSPLTLLVLALAAWSFGRPDRRWRLGGGLALGLAFGCFWVTREEGVWLLPSLLVLWLGLWLTSRRSVPVGASALLPPLAPRQRLARVLGVTVAVLAGWLAIYGGVLLLNRHFYGIANTVEFKQREFLRAYGALTRVSPDTRIRHVPVPAATLARIAAESPSLASLMPALQSHREAWAGTGCEAYGLAPCDGEWRGGWFMWALREAAAANGHYQTALAARAFYRRLAEEVNLACSDGRLTCGPERASMAPPFGRDDIAPTLAAFRAGVEQLTRFQQSGPPIASLGSPYYLRVFFDLVGGPYVPPGPVLIVRARLLTPAPVQTVAISDRGDGFYEVQTRPIADLPPDSAGRRSTRLDVETDCTAPGCRLFVGWQGGTTSLAVADILPGGGIERDGIRLETELVRDTRVQPILPTAVRGQQVLRALQPIGRAYGLAMPVLSALALLGLIWQIVIAIRSRQLDFVLLLQLALWTGIGSRLLLLSVLDATMMPGINTLYLAPLYPMLLAAVGLALWRGGEAVAGYSWRSRGGS